MRKDRNGMILLLAVILIAVLGHVIIRRVEFTERYDYSEWLAEMKRLDLEQQDEVYYKHLTYFDPNTVSGVELDSLDLPVAVKKNLIRYRNAGGHFSKAADFRKIYGMTDSLYILIEPYLLFPELNTDDRKKIFSKEQKSLEGNFNPNTATKEILNDYGLNDFQASNLIKYREHGGKFQKHEDLLKIYGIDTATFENIKRNVIFNLPVMNETISVIDTIPLIELNSVDSAGLVQLKGIGPVFASRIIKYRQMLGGFYSTEQLLEVYGFPVETFNNLKEYFHTDTLKVNTIRLNFAEYSQLIRHPYMNKEVVNSILNYREQNGAFKIREELVMNNLVDSVSYKRLRPYLTCR